MPEIDWLAEAEALRGELFALRREFHREPELGNREFRTADRIERVLRSCGIETERLLDTAVVGVLRGGKPGPCAALRTDMDALPVTETTGCEFTSENEGVMHACGHDIHMTSALGAAMILSRHRESLPGTVKFFFQPDEEGNGGAARMIAAGCMEGVGAVFGMHVSPSLPVGKIGVRYGKFYAASDVFDITVTGKSSHGAEPEKGIDALAAAAEAVGEFRRLPALFPDTRSVVSVGMLRSGTAVNIIADHAEFSGMIRTLGPETRQAMQDALRAAAGRIAEKTGARFSVVIRGSYGGIVNGTEPTRLAHETAVDLFGGDNVCVIEEPTLTTEDFGCFIDAADGTYYHIGAGCSLPLHNSGFLPDENVIPRAAAMHAAVLERYLHEKRPLASI